MISMSVIVSVFMCLSANTFLELHFQSSPNFLCMLPMAVSRSCFGNFAIVYVLLFLWLMSCLHMMTRSR